MSSQVLCSVLITFFFFLLLLNCRNSLYILDINLQDNKITSRILTWIIKIRYFLTFCGFLFHSAHNIL